MRPPITSGVNYNADILLGRYPHASAELRKRAGKAAAALNSLSEKQHSHPGRLFHASGLTPEDVLEHKIDVLRSLLSWYASQPVRVMDEAARRVDETTSISTLPSDVKTYLNKLQRRDWCQCKEGAENFNYILNETTVFKLSKKRHHEDLYSFIKLALNMNVVYSVLDGYCSDEQALRVRVAGREMFFLRTDHGFTRLICQPFASGSFIKELDSERKRSPKFKKAWSYFLDLLDHMRSAHSIVLDITDSSVGMRPQRGNVLNTKNIVVTEDSRGFTFTVIDPDVFDTDGSHKFYPSEYLRPSLRKRRGALKAFTSYLKYTLLNLARDKVVLYWQDRWMKRTRPEL